MQNYAISSDKLSLPYCEYLDTPEPKMLVYGEIGTDIDCTLFARTLMTLDQLAEQRGYKRICLLFNSEGGQVEKGMSIYDAILSTKIPVDGYVTGRANSMAGVLFQACRKRYMTNYAQQMIHGPSGSTNSKQIEKAKESLVKMLARHGVSETKIAELMNKESWLIASECKELKLCDEVVSISKLNNCDDPKTLWKQLETVENNLKNTPMKTIAVTLGLTENASETEITAKAKELGLMVKDNKLVKFEETAKTENKSTISVEVSPELKNMFDKLNGRLDQFEENEKKRVELEAENKITNKVNALVAAGKIANDEPTINAVKADLKASFDVASKLYDAMPGKVTVKAEKVTDLIASSSKESVTNKQTVDAAVKVEVAGVTTLKADEGTIDKDGMFVPKTPEGAKKMTINAAKAELTAKK